jgi:hypothetical protein
MPTLESKLIIGAKDETGGAFASIQKHIAAIDKQIATFDKLMAATRGVAAANDPMITAIDRGAKSLAEEKVALEALSRAMSLGVGSAEEMAAVQGRLARETTQATRAMSRQGEEAVRASGKMKRAREGGGLVGMGGGLIGTIVGFEAAEFGVKAVEGGATLDQALAKLRTTGVADTDVAQARAGYADFAKTHGGMTEAEYLTKYGEARTMSADPLKTTRDMALVSTALRNSGVETGPDEVRSFIKAVDELTKSSASRAGETSQPHGEGQATVWREYHWRDVAGGSAKIVDVSLRVGRKIQGELFPVYAAIARSDERQRHDDCL